MIRIFAVREKGELMSDWVGIFIILILLFCGGFALGIKWRDSLKTLLNSKDLIEKIKNGITASNGNSEYFIGLRNGMRWCLSLIDDKEPIYEPD